MIVFVSMRYSDSPTYPERRDAISHDWCRWFDRHGVCPVLIPNALSAPEAILDKIDGRGLLLTGGDDIVADDRERTEARLLAGALERGLPVFGVCRGLQMINRFLGGAISSTCPTNHVATEHDVAIVDTLDGELHQTTMATNSFHGQCVMAADLAADLRAFAITDDGVVEGLYHPRLPITAIQWHPERTSPSGGLDNLLTNRWTSQCT